MKRLILMLFMALPLSAQGPVPAREVPEWNRPFESFRIIGNIYYVGANDIAVYLITTPAGHILLDTGYEETVPITRKGIERLGFQLKDIRIMLSSHAHFDHVAGHAAMKQATGARVIATAADAELLESGGRKDFRFGDELSFPTVKVDRVIKAGEPVSLGGTTLIPHITPGHTPGNTTWTMAVEDGGRKYNVVFAGSLTINPGVRLVNYAPYPNIAGDYAKAFQVMKSLPCDVFLAPHAQFYKMAEKRKLLDAGGQSNPFIDPKGYQAYIGGTEQNYLKQLKAESSGK